MGGNAPDAMVGLIVGLNDIGPDWDAYYHIETTNIFLDRSKTSGASAVDAGTNANAVRIELGSGADTVFAGLGNDTIWGGAGNDALKAGGSYSYGGTERDLLTGVGMIRDPEITGGGHNTVSGGAGNDSIESGSGNDKPLGGSGDDRILASSGNDYLSGGGDADRLRGGDGRDTLFGGSGADGLYGQDGDDYLVGGSGADTLMGGVGNDTLFGGSGGDVFAFDDGFGQDVINDFRPGDRINLAADLNDTGIQSATDLIPMVSGGTTEAGTKYTLITIGGDTIRLEKVDHTVFVNQIDSWVKVG